MKFRLNDRQRGYALTAIWVFTICALIALAALRWSDLVGIFQEAISVLAPILIGLVIAYLFSPLQNWLEQYIMKLTDRKKPHPRLRRALSVTATMIVILLGITGLVMSIVPELISSIKNLLVSLPDYLTIMSNWITAHIATFEKEQPQIYSALISIWNNAQTAVSNFADQFEPKLDSLATGGAGILSTLTSGAISVVNWVMNFVLGLIMAIYVLYNKERYQAQGRKFLYAFLPEEHVHNFLRIGSHVSYTFMHFLSGKTVDSLIMGLLCFIGMTILKMPYITLISILVGVTNIIPFFGPILGAVPSALLILLSEPKKVIPFVIFILVLQQFDGNILGPKILGDTLGLPMFWILFAITVGGGMMGFIGMVAFVPMFAAVYTLLSDFIKERLEKRGLPSDTESYLTNELHSAKMAANEKVYELVTPDENSMTEFILPGGEQKAVESDEPPSDEEFYHGA